MKRHTKQLLACLLALAMFATNVDAVYAAPAGAVNENGGVQTAAEGVQYTVGADGRVTMTPVGDQATASAEKAGSITFAGSEATAAVADDGTKPASEQEVAEEPADEETEPVSDPEIAEDEQDPAEEEEFMPVLTATAPERVGDPEDPVVVTENTGAAGLNTAYHKRKALDDETGEGTGRTVQVGGADVYEWSTLGLSPDDGETPMGGIVAEIYEAYLFDNAGDASMAYLNGNLGSVTPRERIYTTSFAKVAELIRNYDKSGYLSNNDNDGNFIYPAYDYGFAWRVYLDGERQAHLEEEQVVPEDYPGEFHVGAADLQELSLGVGFSDDETNGEQRLYDMLACLDLNGCALYVDGEPGDAEISLTLPILDTYEPDWDGDDNPDITWYGLKDPNQEQQNEYHCAGKLEFHVDSNTQKLILAGAVRVGEVNIFTENYDYGSPTQTIIGGDLIVKAGTFECRDFSYRGMHLEVNDVAFQAGACDEEIDEDTNEPVEGTGSHIYIGAPDDEYADEVIYPENNGSIELTGDTYRETNPRIYFNVGTGHPSLVPAALFGNGVCIGPNVIIYADGLQLGSVNVHTEARDQYDNEIPTGTLTTKRLPQILLTNEDFEGEDYTGFVPHTLHVYGHVFSDGLHDCPLLKVGLDLNKDGEPDGEGEQDEPLEAGDTVYFYDEQSEVAPGFENAHIRVGTHKEYDEDLEEEVDVTDSTGNSSMTYVVAGSDTLRWGRAKDEYGILQDGMILVDPDSLPLELEYLVGGTVEPGAQGFVFRKGEQTGGSSVERFADFREASSFLRTLNGDVAAVLTIRGDITDGGNLDLSWTTRNDDAGMDELHGVTTLYVVNGMEDDPETEELEVPVVDSSTEEHYGETVFTEMPNVAVYLDDQVKWAYRRFDLRGTGDILYLGSEALTGETVRDGFLDNMDVYVPCGTVRLGDPHITSEMTVDLNDTRLDACRILVHGGAWRVHRILVRAGKLKNGSPVSTNYQMESNAGLLGLADGGAGMLQIVKYHQKRDSSTPEATSAHSILVADTIDVMRNVQPNWIEEEYPLGFKFTVMERDVYDEIILREEEIYTEDEAPEARILVGKGAQLTSPHGINGQSRYIQEPHFGAGFYVKWDGTTTTEPEDAYDVEMLDTEELNPVYASPVLWSDGTVEIERSDLYGLVLGADSLTTVNANLHMLTQRKVDEYGDYLEYTDGDGRTLYVNEALPGSYTWLEGGAALLTQAGGSIEFNEPGFLGTGGVRAYVPVSDEEHWYHALHIRGGEPEAEAYAAKTADLTPVLTAYLPTLSGAAVGGSTLQVGMYDPPEEILEGWDDPIKATVFIDENGTLYYLSQGEPEAVPLVEIKREWTVLDTDEVWSAERQARIRLLKEQATSSGTMIVPVTDLTPRFSWWDGTDESGERVGTPNGTLRFGYPFEVYRRVFNVVYDEVNGEPECIEEGFGDYEEGSYLRGFNTWQEAEAYLDSTSDGTAAAKALFELKKTDFGTYEDDQQQTQNILHDDGTIGVPSLEDNGNGFEVAWTDRLPVYVVLVGDGVTLGANPAMPKQTETLILEGSTCGNTVSFTGTMTLATETMFHGITMDARAATIHVNDQELTLNWTTGRIGTLKGKKAYEIDSSGRYAADGRVSILAPADDEYGLNWIRYMNDTYQSVDLYITQGVQALGMLSVDVQGVARGENDLAHPAYPVFVNADPADDSQWYTSWKPVTVGNMIFYSGKFASGAMTVECALDAGDENVSETEPSLTVVTGKLTVNGSARIVGNRQVHTSSGDIYIKDFMDMDTQGGIYSAGSLTVDGTVLLGGSYSNVDTDRSVTVWADKDITIGDRLISGSKGNQIVYGGKFTVKDVKVLEPWDDPDDDTDPETKWTLTPNEDETSYKAKDGNPEENDQEAPENAILLVAKKLEKDGVYCYADEDGALATVTGSVGLYEMNDAYDWVTNKLLDDGIAAQALLFADYNNPGYGQSSTYWLTRKRGTGIYVKKSLRVNVLLKQEGSNAGEEYDTLQEALDAIDAKKDKTAVYTVTIDRKAAAKDNNKVTPATITGSGTAAEKTTYAAIKLPTNLAGLTVCAAASEDPDVNPAVLYTSGDLKAASSLTLDNVQFMRWDNTKGQYATVTAAEPNGKPVTAKVSIASGTLTIAHTVAFDTPVLFDGGGKAAFELAPKDSEIPTALYAGMGYRLTGDTYLDEDGQPVPVLDEFGDPVLAEDENGDPIPVLDENGEPVLDENDDPVYEYVYQTEAAQTVKTALAKRDQLNYGTDQIISTKQRALVDGGFQGFANVTLPGDSTIILSGEYKGKSPVFNNIGSFVADKPFFYMIDPVAKPGTAKITNLTMDGGLFVTEGALSVTTLSLGKKAEVAAFGDFKVTGDVINRADSSWSENYATLTTVQKIKATATASTGGSQLTVAGEVVNPDDSLPIRVKLLAGEGSDPQFAQYSPVMLSQQIWPGAECFSKLLTAPKATAEAFAPHPDNVKWNGNSSATAFKINSADHANEYLVRKEKNDIYVESGSVVEVALAEGIVNEDNSVDDATAIAGASYIGAYKTWKEAVAAVDALKDKEASYTLVLVKDINCTKTEGSYTYAPAAITMPAQAAKVKVMSTDAVQDVDGNGATTGVQPHVLCYSGNFTLKQDTDFRHVKFAPYTNAANPNTNNQFAAGKYALGLDSCEWTGICPGSITGAKGGSLTVTGNEITVWKNVSGFTAVNLWEDMSVSAGNFTADTLTLVGDAVLYACSGAVTVTDVYTVDVGDNKHGIGFTKSSNGKGKSNLTIKGQVMTLGSPLVLELMKTGEQNQLTDEEFAAQVALKLDKNNKDKVLTDAAAQIAEIGLTPTQAVKVKIGNTAYGFGMAVSGRDSYFPVKANKSLYLAPIPAVPQNNAVRPEMNETQAKLLPALTMLTVGNNNVFTSLYLDLSQAVAEIDALGNRSWKYQASPGVLAASMYPGLVGEDGVLQVSDTNVTDANKYSPLPLPKKDKADALEIGLSAGYRTELCFTGKLSGSGDVAFKNVVFHPCKAAKDDTVTTFDITMAQNSQLPDGFWPASALRFHSDNAAYDLVPDGTIGKITGVKAVAGKNAATQITFNKTMLTMATGFAGTVDVTLTNAQILTRGANDIGTLTLTQTGTGTTDLATLTSYGNLKLADVNVSGVTDNSKAWIAAKEDTKDNSTISISGNVKTPQDKYLAVRIINKDKKADTKNAELFVTDLGDENNICGFYVTEDDYTNGRKLVLAPVADATAIRALPLLNALTEGEYALTSYKTTDKYVVNGYLYDMMVLVTSYEEDPFTGDAQAVSPVAETYAKTWYEAVQIIENANRPDMYYSMKLLRQGDCYTGTGGAQGAITLPSKAAMVRIYSDTNNYGVFSAYLKFTGAFTAKCPLQVWNVGLMAIKKNANDEYAADQSGFLLDAGTKSVRVHYQTSSGLTVSGIKGNQVILESMAPMLTVNATGAVSAKDLQVGTNTQLIVVNGDITSTAILQDQNTNVYCPVGNVKATDYTAYGQSTLKAGGDITVSGTLEVNDQEARGVQIECENDAKKITLGQIRGTVGGADNDTLEVRYKLTKPTMVNGNVTKAPVSNLKITGTCDGAELLLVPQIWQPGGNGKHEGWYLLANRDKYNDEADREAIDKKNYYLVATAAADFAATQKRLAEMPTMPAGSVNVKLGDDSYTAAAAIGGIIEGAEAMDHPDGAEQILLKQGGNLFLTTVRPVVQVVAMSPKGDGTNSVYQGTFFTLDEAAKEVDKIGVKVNGSYATNVTYTLLQDVNVTVGVDENGNQVVTGINGTPAAKIPLPKAMRSLLINGQNHAIGFTGGTFALSANTMLRNTELVYLKKVPQGPIDGYTAQPYAVNLGAYSLDWCTQTRLPFDNMVGKISGTGALKVWPGIELSAFSVSVKDLTLQAQEVEQNGVRILNTSKLWAGTDITVSNLATLGGDTRLFAGGKITMNDVLLDLDPGEDQNTCWDATWTAASDKNPKTYQITVNGTIRMAEDDNTPTIFRKESEAPIVVGTWTDAGAGEAVPTEAGTVLAAAPKASDAWFRPAAGKDAAGQAVAEDTFFVYKSGKNIIYDPGKKQDRVAGLVCYRNYVDADGNVIYDGGGDISVMSDFLTLTEALKEVDNLAATMEPGKEDNGDPIVLNKGVKLPYARYIIVLYGDADVKNAQGTAYAALPLPSKTSDLGICADEEEAAIRFSGGLTLKSDLALTGDVNPVSMKSVTVNRVKTDVPTAANYTLGTYRLTIADTGRTYGIYEQDGVEYETVGNVTATAGKGGLILKNGSDNLGQIDRQLRVRIAGTLNSDVELGPDTMLTVGGAATVGTLTFDATDWGQIAPVFAADKALTLGAVVQHADMTKTLRDQTAGKIWKKDLSTPVTVKGTKVNGETVSVIRDSQGADLAPCVKLYLGTAASVPTGTKAATGPGLSAADWDLYAGDLDVSSFYDSYIGYVYKNALYVGAQNKP